MEVAAASGPPTPTTDGPPIGAVRRDKVAPSLLSRAAQTFPDIILFLATVGEVTKYKYFTVLK